MEVLPRRAFVVPSIVGHASPLGKRAPHALDGKGTAENAESYAPTKSCNSRLLCTSSFAYRCFVWPLTVLSAMNSVSAM